MRASKHVLLSEHNKRFFSIYITISKYGALASSLHMFSGRDCSFIFKHSSQALPLSIKLFLADIVVLCLVVGVTDVLGGVFVYLKISFFCSLL